MWQANKVMVRTISIYATNIHKRLKIKKLSRIRVVDNELSFVIDNKVLKCLLNKEDLKDVLRFSSDIERTDYDRSKYLRIRKAEKQFTKRKPATKPLFCKERKDMVITCDSLKIKEVSYHKAAEQLAVLLNVKKVNVFSCLKKQIDKDIDTFTYKGYDIKIS